MRSPNTFTASDHVDQSLEALAHLDGEMSHHLEQRTMSESLAYRATLAQVHATLATATALIEVVHAITHTHPTTRIPSLISTIVSILRLPP